MSMTDNRCVNRVMTGIALGGTVGGAVGACYGTYEAFSYGVRTTNPSNVSGTRPARVPRPRDLLEPTPEIHTFDADRAPKPPLPKTQIPGMLKVRHIGRTTMGSAALFGLFLGAGSLLQCGRR